MAITALWVVGCQDIGDDHLALPSVVRMGRVKYGDE
jgi:hypothetical protein